MTQYDSNCSGDERYYYSMTIKGYLCAEKPSASAG